MPNYITGPAILRRGGVSIYLESGITKAIDTKTGKVVSDFHGEIDEYMISRMIMLSGKPVDAIGNLSTIFGLGTANVGDSIFKGAARTIASASVANPSVITVTGGHNLGPAGTTISGTIAGTTTTPTINGTQVATVINSTTFSVPVNVSSGQAGPAGTFTPASEPIQIVSKNDNAIYTFERGGFFRAPKLHLGASKGVFSGDIQFAVLGSVTKTQTAADHWKSAVAAAFADTTFDETKFKRYRYVAAYGSAPFDAMTGQDGFDVSIDYATEEIPDDNFGIGDIILKSVTAGVSFTPSNLTEAQVETLIGLQDAAAILPGDSLAGVGGEDLVITGEDATTGFEVTLYGAGFKDSKAMFAVGKLRNGEVSGMTKRTWATGVANPLFGFVVT